MFWPHIFSPDYIAQRKALIEREARYPVPSDVMFRLLHGDDDYRFTRAVLEGKDLVGRPLGEVRRAA